MEEPSRVHGSTSPESGNRYLRARLPKEECPIRGWPFRRAFGKMKVFLPRFVPRSPYERAQKSLPAINRSRFLSFLQQRNESICSQSTLAHASRGRLRGSCGSHVRFCISSGLIVGCGRCRGALIHYTRHLTRIPVQTPSRSYDVLVERGLLGSAVTTLREILPSGSRVFAVTSPRVRKHWGSTLTKSCNRAGPKLEVLDMPDGERSKKLSQLERLAAKLVKRGADRRSVILAFGGGVVGDVGGFLASVFMRGVPVVQIPTTLLAQVDSAIGGKTGVNLASGKNLIGTFHQPLAVLVDPDVLATLPEREY